MLRDGDGLRAGGRAASSRCARRREQLVEVRAATPRALLRLAWHLGNRHLPAEIAADGILIRDDHVIVDMLQGLGAEVPRGRRARSTRKAAPTAEQQTTQPGHVITTTARP